MAGVSEADPRITAGIAAPPPVIADCDARLARYQAAPDAGGDPATIAGWTRTVTAQRAAALARAITRPASSTPLTEHAIQQIIQSLGDIRDVIRKADPASKARIYNPLELRLTYQPGQNRVHAQANLNPSERGGMGSVRGGIDPIPPRLDVDEDLWLRLS